MKQVVWGSWLALSLPSMATHAQERLPIKQIDHIMWATTDKDALAAFLVDTLLLPLVWPGPGSDWSYSTGISFGNVDIELTPVDEMPETNIISLALQPVDFGSAHDFLEKAELSHFEPAMAEPGDRWSSIGFRGMGHPMFFIQFHTHDMDERRARFAGVLRNRQGGPLGVERVREVRLSVDRAGLPTDQWLTLLGPPEPGSEFLWPVGDGPSIRLVDSTEPSTEGLVVEVKSFRDAVAAARALDLVSSITADTLRLDPMHLGGLVLLLVGR